MNKTDEDRCCSPSSTRAALPFGLEAYIEVVTSIAPKHHQTQNFLNEKQTALMPELLPLHVLSTEAPALSHGKLQRRLIHLPHNSLSYALHSCPVPSTMH